MGFISKFQMVLSGLYSLLLKKPLIGTIIITDRCNLSCKHCSVGNLTTEIYPYKQIIADMQTLYAKGARVLVLCGGETLLWEHAGKTAADLIKDAKCMGFLYVNIVTNGTHKIDVPLADLILVSVDGDRKKHNIIRSDTYDIVMKNIDEATTGNICLYMAINRINKDTVIEVAELARVKKNVKAVSFNFHTPYPETTDLLLSVSDKIDCCKIIARLIDDNYPVLNLKSAFEYIVNNSFPTPCRQCILIENGKLSICGRCIDIPGLCDKCGYFFAAEYSLIFSGKIKVIAEMIKTYPKYI